MGGTKSNMCNEIAKDIWLWGVENNTWLSAAFIPGKEKHEADKASRQFIDATEWMLNTNVFNESQGYTDNPKMANSTLVPSSTSSWCKESKLWAKERLLTLTHKSEEVHPIAQTYFLPDFCPTLRT